MITKLKDPLLAELRELQAKPASNPRRRVIYGENAVNWARDAGVKILSLFGLQEKSGLDVQMTTEGILRQLSPTSHLIELIAVVEVKEESFGEDPMVVVLEEIKDMGNMGTILRAALAFGLSQVVIIGERIDLYSRRIIEASRGAVFHLRSKQFENATEACEFLHSKGFQIAATTPHEGKLAGLVELSSAPLAVVLGNESEGVSQELLNHSDLRIMIPLAGPMESLNVGVAAGISLYELATRQVLATLGTRIHQTLGRALSSASFALRALFDKRLKEVSHLSAKEAIALMILHQKGKDELTSHPFLASAEEGEQIVASLEEKNLVNIENDQVSLSPSAPMTLAQLWSIHEATESQALSGFTSSERQALFDHLARINTNCVFE